MGVLDDAIREHLELKRKRGADPAEVAQQEREALGPLRGGAAPATADAEPAAPEHAELDEPALDAEPVAPPPPPPAREELHQPTQQYSVDDLEDLRPEPEPEPEPAPPPPPPAAREPAPPPPPPATREHAPDPPEDVVPADEDPEPDAEDVLDETPDFLQEAPEHDRLWFEQRPPRDFDF